MIVALFPNPTIADSRNTAKKVMEHLEKKGIEVVVRGAAAEALEATAVEKISPERVDLCVTFGGDGTILRMVHEYPDLKAPILAINMGTIGFMADTQVKEVFEAVDAVVGGSFSVQERIMMEAEVAQGSKSFAVNEVVIHRSQVPSLIELAVSVGGRHVNTFAADGLILSTPTGSTAYSLASGGPILTPDLDAFVITPICPHTISNRPIVISPNQDIVVQYLSRHDPIEVTCDGIHEVALSTGQSLTVRKAQRRFRLVTLSHNDYYKTLRTKLAWSGRLKPWKPES